MEGKRLTRSRSERMIGGVCGGLAEYFNIDPTLVRLAFVLAFFAVSGGFWLYIIMWVIIPEEY
jgi:phage shock protein C